MKIASSTLQLESSHTKSQHHEIRESLRTWGADRRPAFDTTGQTVRNQPSTSVQISDDAKAAQSSEASAIQDGLEAAENDPMLRLIRAMISMLTGRDVEVFDASELNVDSSPAPDLADPNQVVAEQSRSQPAGFGVEYDYHESYSESEQTTFSAAGVIRTEDGKEIKFDLSLSMARSYHEETNVSIRLGDTRQKKDPLVINFGGNAAQLTSQRFKFDLDANGQTEEINFVTGGSGFLALDRNGDGKINDGTELFGAKTGEGFAELAALDADKNGWIDENDAAYADLRVWTKNGTGADQLSTLEQANVGAISLAHIATPFDLKDAQNELQGEIRSSGVYLQENGTVGTIQQIDLTV